MAAKDGDDDDDDDDGDEILQTSNGEIPQPSSSSSLSTAAKRKEAWIEIRTVAQLAVGIVSTRLVDRITKMLVND